MPKINNISMYDFENKNYQFKPEDTIVIQIVDNDMNFPVNNDPFFEIHQFKFLDVEKETVVNDPSFKISDSIAQVIVRVLQKGLDLNKNILVHCVMGVCRSGAVCEVGSMMGYEPISNTRIPNCLVKYMLMKQLGWTYD